MRLQRLLYGAGEWKMSHRMHILLLLTSLLLTLHSKQNIARLLNAINILHTTSLPIPQLLQSKQNAIQSTWNNLIRMSCQPSICQQSA